MTPEYPFNFVSMDELSYALSVSCRGINVNLHFYVEYPLHRGMGNPDLLLMDVLGVRPTAAFTASIFSEDHALIFLPLLGVVDFLSILETF